MPKNNAMNNIKMAMKVVILLTIEISAKTFVLFIGSLRYFEISRCPYVLKPKLANNIKYVIIENEKLY